MRINKSEIYDAIIIGAGLSAGIHLALYGLKTAANVSTGSQVTYRTHSKEVRKSHD